MVRYFLFFILVLHTIANAQQTPDKQYGQLFTDVQTSGIFADSKTFVDCTPKRKPALIIKDYTEMKNNPAIRFSLKKFVEDNFELQKQPNVINTKEDKTPTQHIEDLWKILTRAQDRKVEGSSLLPLPKPYIVPGGRFTEVYYWDSYFTMLGLRESGEVKTIENMVDNFAFLINTYGHIPNGNRTYYLSRSQPPFFSMMVELLAGIKGKAIYKKYLTALQKEYNYWMEGVATLKTGTATKRVIKLDDGTVLNRYWDDLDIPRQEGYVEDVKTAEQGSMEKMMTIRFANEKAMNEFKANTEKNIYRNMRAGACSGWDFSSRWYAEADKLHSTETLNIAPVDLNCLLYNLENVLQKAGGTVNKKINSQRATALRYLFWNENVSFFTDYHFVKKQKQEMITAAGLYPLNFLTFASNDMASLTNKIAAVVKTTLLKDGGLLSTPNNTGQQWDAPNGWAPLQWMAINGLSRCGQEVLAKEIATRWIKLNNKVYKATGKFTEKYNVVDMSLETGGGEYPNLDGFGWTNGVYLALVKKYGL
jgi:alpha,alpha-trehalase